MDADGALTDEVRGGWVRRVLVSPNLWRVAGALCLACMLAFLLMIAFGASARLPTGAQGQPGLPHLADRPLAEDGYLMMLVAWNLAADGEFASNFHMVTTGVQPLTVLVQAAIAKLVQAFGGDKIAFARAVLAFGALNAAALGPALGWAAQQIAPTGRASRGAEFWFCVTLASLSFYLCQLCTIGLETGIYLTLFAVMIGATARFLRGRRRHMDAIALGVLAGVCGLARIDFGVVLAVALGACLLLRQMKFVEVMIVGLAALAVVSPWFIWVHAASGSWLPSSGPAQSRLVDLSSAGHRLKYWSLAMMQNLAPWAASSGLAKPALVLVAGLAALLFAAREQIGRLLASAHGAARMLLPWAAGVLVLASIYPIMFWAEHFYSRYTAPVAVVVIVGAATLFASISEVRRGVTFIAFLAVSLMINVALPTFLDSTAWRGLVDGRVESSVVAGAAYVQDRLPPDAKVGAFQSGVVGYYNPNTINLDGKVNNEALKAIATGRLEAYALEAGVAYVVDWPVFIRDHFSAGLAAGRWAPCSEPVPGGYDICIRRVSEVAGPFR